MMTVLLEDCSTEGHESEDFWFEKLMRDPCLKTQEKYHPDADSSA
jgi:hypothetical protein